MPLRFLIPLPPLSKCSNQRSVLSKTVGLRDAGVQTQGFVQVRQALSYIPAPSFKSNVHVPRNACGCQRTIRFSRFSPTMWFGGIKLMWSGSEAPKTKLTSSSLQPIELQAS